MLSAAIVAVGAYLGLLVVLRLSEPRLIYAPGPARPLAAPPPALGLPVERAEIRTEDGLTLVSWIIRTADSAAPWLLICHGNGGNLSDAGRPEHYASLRSLGLNLLAFDYRGYGESEGKPSEAGLYRDAHAAYRLLADSLAVPPERIYLFGHSLGSAVAVELAGRVGAAGLILDGALTSVAERGQELYPYVPVRWIAASRYASIERIGALRLPKLFLHAEHDEVVPIGHGRRLYQAAPAPKRFVERAGGHGDAFIVDAEKYYGAIERFVAETQPTAAP